MPRRLTPLVSASAGLLLAGAFPPLNWWPQALVWLVPLLWVLHESPARAACRRPWWFGFRQGWCAGAAFFLATLWWVGHVSTPGMLALCAYLGLYPAVWAGFAAVLPRRSPAGIVASAAIMAGLWCGLELLRGTLLSGFPWNGAAVPLVAVPGVRDWAETIGVTGVAWLPVFLQCLVHPLRREPFAWIGAGLFALTVAGWALSTSLGRAAADREITRPLTLALVQPNVSMEDKMFGDETVQQRRYDELIALSREALTKTPQLLVWPESALPGWFHDAVAVKAFDPLLGSGTALVTGCDAEFAEGAAADDWQPRNCVALVAGTSDNFQLHAKVRLVPFGEFIPFRRQLPFFESMLGHLIPRDFAPGTRLQPFSGSPGLPEIIPLVCFEDTIGSHVRKFAGPAPQLLVNVTNDNWFHHSPAAAMHALNARWRCLELRRPMVRSANTGVTCAVDADGRIVAALPPFTAGVLHVSLPVPRAHVTWFARHGDLFSAVAGLTALCMAFATLRFSRRPAAPPAPSA